MNKWFVIDSWKGDLVLLIARLTLGGGMALAHGLSKFEKLMAGGEIKFYSFLGLGAEISLGLAVFAEFFASIFLAIGFYTRFSLIPLIITMAVAAFAVHGGDPFSKMEKSLLYLVTYLILLFVGPGKFSLDYLRQSRK